MGEGVAYFGKHEGVVVLKLVGRFTFSMRASKSLDTFIDTMLMEEDYDNILIDLTETESLDSTSLGLLAILTRLTMDLYDRQATIVSTDPYVNDILDGVGFAEVFNIVHDPPHTRGELEALDEGDPTKKELSRVVLNAHRELLELNEKNKDTFKDVVAMLEKQAEDED